MTTDQENPLVNPNRERPDLDHVSELQRQAREAWTCGCLCGECVAETGDAQRAGRALYRAARDAYRAEVNS